MIDPRSEGWFNRPVYIAAAGFLAGAAVAGLVLFFVLRRGSGSDHAGQATKTAARGTPGTPTSGTPSGTVTGATTATAAAPTPGRFHSPADALAAFVQSSLHQTYLGPCPPSATGQSIQGTCSKSLYESDLLATYYLGPPLSEAIGEAVLTVSNGAWSLDFVPAPAAGAALVVGANAVVYGAGDCLKFHAAAGVGAATKSCEFDGTKARVTEGPAQADSIAWWKLEGFGWASGQFLAPAQ